MNVKLRLFDFLTACLLLRGHKGAAMFCKQRFPHLQTFSIPVFENLYCYFGKCKRSLRCLNLLISCASPPPARH